MGAVRDMYLCSAPLHCREIHRRVCGAIVERKYAESNQQIANTLMSFLIICMYASAWVTSMFGIEAIIGSFMFGLIVPRSSRIFHVCTERLEVFVHVIMLPLYFAQSGLSTDFTVSRPTVVDCCHSCRDIRQSSGSWYSFVPSRHSSERVRRHRCADEY